jgi:hypothetical protein
MLDQIVKGLETVDRLSDLDTLLTAREGLRRCYSAMHDAFAVTHNPLFADYCKRLAAAGLMCNADIQEWFEDAQILHGSNPGDLAGAQPTDPAA